MGHSLVRLAFISEIFAALPRRANCATCPHLSEQTNCRRASERANERRRASGNWNGRPGLKSTSLAGLSRTCARPIDQSSGAPPSSRLSPTRLGHCEWPPNGSRCARLARATDRVVTSMKWPMRVVVGGRCATPRPTRAETLIGLDARALVRYGHDERLARR